MLYSNISSVVNKLPLPTVAVDYEYEPHGQRHHAKMCCFLVLHIHNKFKQTNNNVLLEKDGGTKN